MQHVSADVCIKKCAQNHVWVSYAESLVYNEVSMLSCTLYTSVLGWKDAEGCMIMVPHDQSMTGCLGLYINALPHQTNAYTLHIHCTQTAL